ncbi:MAG: hypothetical protein Q3965_02065, partial [Rothia sp. (in: high G+C Gram-positive bacteria)]|nr:hypothetical protein [Rothia sp. (in: high G+C Gram-positive bacteria)]
GEITRAYYNEEGKISEVHVPNGSKSIYTYDSNGQRIGSQEPGRGSSYCTYDSTGNYATFTTPSLGKVIYERDSTGELTGTINALGGHVQITYDHNGLPVKAVAPNGATEEYLRNDDGKVVRRKNLDGSLSHATYSSDGNLIAQQHPNGSVEEWAYDQNSNEKQYSINGQLFYSIDYQRKSKRTLATTTENLTPVGQWVEQFTMDPNLHHAVIEREANGLRVAWNLDQFNRPLDAIGPDGLRLSQRYNQCGDLSHMLDSTGYCVTYTKDNQGRVQSHTSPTVTYQVGWENGLPVSLEAQQNVGYGSLQTHTSFIYDKESALITDVMRNDEVYSFSYDAGRQLTGLYHANAQGQHSQTRWEYNTTGQLVREVTAEGIEKIYSYTPDSRLLSISASDGSLIENTYDAMGQRTRTVFTGGERDGEVHHFGWDMRGYLWSLDIQRPGQETESHKFWYNVRNELAWVDGVFLTWDTSTLSRESIVAINRHTITAQEHENIRVGASVDYTNIWRAPSVPLADLPAGFEVTESFGLALGDYEIGYKEYIDSYQRTMLKPRPSQSDYVGHVAEFNRYAINLNVPVSYYSIYQF